jgi:hypothetical protein
MPGLISEVTNPVEEARELEPLPEGCNAMGAPAKRVLAFDRSGTTMTDSFSGTPQSVGPDERAHRAAQPGPQASLRTRGVMAGTGETA